MTVQVIRNSDPTQAGGDFLRVYCQRQEGSALSFATIERVFGGEVRARTWNFRTLLSGVPMDTATATELASAYAERKNIPVVYVEVEQEQEQAPTAS
jgi:hypothetical protein